MLQRNTTGYPVDIPSLSVRVEVDAVIDHPDPLAGFTPEPEAKPAKASKTDTATADAPQEG